MTEEYKIQQKIHRLRDKIEKAKFYIKTVALGVAMAAVPTVAEAVPNSNARPDDKPKDKTENVDNSNKNFSNSSSYIVPCSKDIGANWDLGNGVTLLNELPTEGVATYNIQGVTFTNEDFAGAPDIAIFNSLIKRCKKPTKSYRDGVCVAAVKQQVIPLMRKDITPEGRITIDTAIKGCQVDTAFTQGQVHGWVSFSCSGQEETFKNIIFYLSCQYPKNMKETKNYGHLGCRYIDPANGKQYEYRGTPNRSVVTRSGNPNNAYNNNKRKVITRIEYLQHALNKKLENGEILYFIKKDNSNIIDIYTPETLPEKIKGQIAIAQAEKQAQETNLAFKDVNKVYTGQQDPNDPETIQLTSISELKAPVKTPVERVLERAREAGRTTKASRGKNSAGNGDSGENNSDGTAVNVAVTTTDNRNTPTTVYRPDGGRS